MRRACPFIIFDHDDFNWQSSFGFSLNSELPLRWQCDCERASFVQFRRNVDGAAHSPDQCADMCEPDTLALPILNAGATE